MESINILPIYLPHGGDTMTEHMENQGGAEAAESKKVSLADAAKRMLQQKKQAQGKSQGVPKNHESGQPTMKSQNTKKINNQRKRMGV